MICAHCGKTGTRTHGERTGARMRWLVNPNGMGGIVWAHGQCVDAYRIAHARQYAHNGIAGVSHE